jgi:hypothetical protein
MGRRGDSSGRDKFGYRQIYLNRPDSITFIPVGVDTSDRVYDDLNCLLFFTRSSTLTYEIPEESDQFRFLRDTCLANLKGSVTSWVTFDESIGPCSLSSMFCLSGTCWVFTRVLSTIILIIVFAMMI